MAEQHRDSTVESTIGRAKEAIDAASGDGDGVGVGGEGRTAQDGAGADREAGSEEERSPAREDENGR